VNIWLRDTTSLNTTVVAPMQQESILNNTTMGKKDKQNRSNAYLVTSWFLATPVPDYTSLIELQGKVYYSPVR